MYLKAAKRVDTKYSHHTHTQKIVIMWQEGNVSWC